MNDRPMNDPDDDPRPTPTSRPPSVDLGRALAPTSGAGPGPGASGCASRRSARPARRHGAGSTALSRPTGRPLRRGLVLALAALLVLAGIAAAIGFGLPGLRIVILGPGQTTSPSPAPTRHAAPASSAPPSLSPPPTPSPSPAPTSWPLESLGLGDPVDAGGPRPRRRLPGPPADPARARRAARGLRPRSAADDAQVTAAYGATPAIPASSIAPTVGGHAGRDHRHGVPRPDDVGYLKKILPSGTTIEGVTVAGHPGFWIAGQPHELLYVGPDGQVESDPVRLVGNVLAWNDGEL